MTSFFPKPLIFAVSALMLLLLLSGYFSGPPLIADEGGDDLRLYMKGRYVFEKNCAVCHGERGRGNGELAKGVQDKPRNFRTGVFKFRTTPRGFLPTDGDLRRTITRGVSGTMMPAFTKLSNSDIDSVIVYLKNFSPKWDDPKAITKPTPIPDPPDWLSDRTKTATHLKAGRSSFNQHCATCHGPEGKGDGPASKGLKDIWKNDITPANLRQPHHKSGDSLQDLYRTIALGLDGTPMVGYLEIFGEEKIWELAALIKSLERKKDKQP